MSELDSIDQTLLLLGGNVGDVRKNGQWVCEKLAERFTLGERSHWYESTAWGFDGPNFLNCVVALREKPDPDALLKYCLGLEEQLGRARSKEGGYSDRPMDIDVLYISDLVLNQSDLIIPHPRIAERRFTLAPLNECWADFVHPVVKRTQSELLEACTDRGWVRRVEE